MSLSVLSEVVLAIIVVIWLVRLTSAAVGCWRSRHPHLPGGIGAMRREGDFP
jgi:hypothetical protein